MTIGFELEDGVDAPSEKRMGAFLRNRLETLESRVHEGNPDLDALHLEYRHHPKIEFKTTESGEPEYVVLGSMMVGVGADQKEFLLAYCDKPDVEECEPGMYGNEGLEGFKLSGHVRFVEASQIGHSDEPTNHTPGPGFDINVTQDPRILDALRILARDFSETIDGVSRTVMYHKPSYELQTTVERVT